MKRLQFKVSSTLQILQRTALSETCPGSLRSANQEEPQLKFHGNSQEVWNKVIPRLYADNTGASIDQICPPLLIEDLEGVSSYSIEDHLVFLHNSPDHDLQHSERPSISICIHDTEIHSCEDILVRLLVFHIGHIGGILCANVITFAMGLALRLWLPL